MSKSYSNRPESPFAVQRESFANAKRNRFEERRVARLASHKTHALADLDTRPTRD